AHVFRLALGAEGLEKTIEVPAAARVEVEVGMRDRALSGGHALLDLLQGDGQGGDAATERELRGGRLGRPANGGDVGPDGVPAAPRPAPAAVDSGQQAGAIRRCRALSRGPL